jgi:hypothetical protein
MEEAMDPLLRGNYPIEQPSAEEADPRSLEDEFELAALKRLGGSITFVARRKVVWSEDGDEHGPR